MDDPDHQDQEPLPSPRIAARLAWGGVVIAVLVAVGERQWWLVPYFALALLGHFVIRRIWRRP